MWKCIETCEKCINILEKCIGHWLVGSLLKWFAKLALQFVKLINRIILIISENIIRVGCDSIRGDAESSFYSEWES